jgi:hypothetical protein
MSPPEAATLDPELRELGRVVRDGRPTPREDYVVRLDARVANGFPHGKRRRRLPALPKPTMLIPALGTAVCLIAVVGIALSLLDDDRSASTLATHSASAPPVTKQGRMAESAGAAGAGTTAPDAVAQPEPSPVPPTGGDEAPGVRQRKVERSASLSLSTATDDLEDVSDGVVRATDQSGGFVASSQVDSGQHGGTAHFDLRVPSARLDATLAALSKLAHVQSRSQETDDVTGAVVSARERLTDAQAERQALLRALGRARTGTQAEAIRARLRLVRNEIAGARGDVRSLDQRTTFSTVAVTVSADGASSSGDGSFGPGDAAHDAIKILGAVAGGLVIALAILLPVALVGGALWLGVRTARRRSRERALDAV